MNEQQPPCEIWLEAISLLAADCLTEPEEAALRDHFTVCDDCCQRYEEINFVCSNVRIAKPIIDQDRVLAIGRCLKYLPLPVTKVTQRSRTVLWRVAMLATAAVVLVSMLGQLGFRRTEDNPEQRKTIVLVTPQAAPVESADQELPTLFALRRAAAESEEAFDRLLARYSEPSLLEPINLRTFSLESLQ